MCVYGGVGGGICLATMQKGTDRHHMQKHLQHKETQKVVDKIFSVLLQQPVYPEASAFKAEKWRNSVHTTTAVEPKPL